MRTSPGDHTLLGKVYAAGGVKQGEAALADLAQRPATARHIAGKLARHFVADEPPPRACRPAGQGISGHRRRSQGRLDRARRRGRSLDHAAEQDAHARAVPAGGAAGHRPRAGGPRRAARAAQCHGHAAVAAAGTQRLARHGRRLGPRPRASSRASTCRRSSLRGSRTSSTPPSCSRRSPARPHRPRRGRRSREPSRASKAWRCC